MIWLLAPFVSAVAIGATPALRRVVGRFWLPCLLLGWAGLALMTASLLVLDGFLGSAGPALGGVLGGLSMWKRRRPDDDDGGQEPPDGPGVPPPGGDWAAFERDFWTYLHDAPPRREAERVPV